MYSSTGVSVTDLWRILFSMDILFYRYNSIFEPDCIKAFESFGINVVEEHSEIHSKNTSQGDAAGIVAEHIIKQNETGNPFLFVFSINFYPGISMMCEKLGVIYACWSVDCPVLELFSVAIKNRCNRIFLFDQAQYERMHRYNPDCIFYLPLGTNTERLTSVIDTITDEDRAKYSADISFVGSLYNEKSPLRNMKLDDRTRGYIDGIIRSQLMIYGCNFIEDALTEEVVKILKGGELSFDNAATVEPIDRFVAAHSYIGYQLAVEERRESLNMLARDFKVDLYTLSDTSELKNVRVKGSAKTLTEMPKIFNLSKINLNITMRPIQTGLPLRIFDVLGSGGFLLTNYQAEIPSIYEIGEDLEVYTSMEELHDKCAYYLEHEEERKRIALNGYKKTCQFHKVSDRMKTMIEYMLGDK